MRSSIWKNTIFLLIILLLPVVGSAQTEPPVGLLLPGDFHGDDVQIPETTGWWALCADGLLQKTTLSLTAVHDECVDGADEKSGLRIAHSGCIDALALLSDAPFFAEDTLPVCDIDLQNGQVFVPELGWVGKDAFFEFYYANAARFVGDGVDYEGIMKLHGQSD